jgi:hypothetical protein
MHPGRAAFQMLLEVHAGCETTFFNENEMVKGA